MDELPTTRPPTEQPPPTPVVPLDYSPREERPRGSRVIALLRRLCIAAGVAFVLGAILMIMFPRYDEEVVSLSFGVGLILLAIPLPKIPGW